MAIKIVGGRSDESLSYSKCVRAGHYVYLSGMVAFDDAGGVLTGGVADQTRKIFLEMEKLLFEAGCDLSNVVKVNVCLPDPDDFEDFEREYSRWFVENHPARATICAQLTIDAKVEIEAIAYDGNEGGTEHEHF